MGRLIMLLALTQSAMVNESGLVHAGDQRVDETEKKRKVREILDKIYYHAGNDTRDVFEPWNLLMQRAAQDDAQNLHIFIVMGFIRNYFDQEHRLRNILCDSDETRI